MDLNSQAIQTRKIRIVLNFTTINSLTIFQANPAINKTGSKK